MSEKKILKVMDWTDEGEIITDNGTYKLSDKVMAFFKPITNRDYEFTINGDLITYVNFNTDQEKTEPKSEEKKSSFGGTIKDKQILAQSTLKEAVNIAIANWQHDVDVEKVKHIHKELMEYMMEEFY